jgi:hypothetical protein
MSKGDATMLEQNLELLIRKCADPLTPDRIERAGKRFESESRQDLNPVGRWMALAAAVLVAAFSIWLIGGHRPPCSTPGAQEASPRSKEIEGWASQLGDENAARRNQAETNFVGLASDLAYALEALEKCQSSLDPEIRSRAQNLRARLLQRAKIMSGGSGGVRAAIARIRSAWLRRQYSNFDEMARASFGSMSLSYVRYVPKIEIGDHLESASNEDYLQFKPYGRFGGRRDLLTREAFQALDGGDGIVGFVENLEAARPAKEDDLSGWGRCLIFTLPDGAKNADGKARWESYVVIAFKAFDERK